MNSAKRVISLLFVILTIFVSSRLIVRALPGDPITTLIAETGVSIPREVIEAELGLNRPFLPALGSDLAKAMKGDLGVSLLSRQPVTTLLFPRVVNTAKLALAALAIGVPLSLLLGIWAAGFPSTRAGKTADRICTLHGAISAALPIPWIAPMLVLLFSVQLDLFPVSGSIGLPALSLALVFSGFWARLIRQRIRETLHGGAAPGARARGAGELRVVTKYGLAPAAGALFGYFGTQFGGLLGGALVTESIFDWPGIGSLLIDSVLKRDYPLVEAAIFVSASSAVLGTVLGDLLQQWWDPRGEQA